MGKTAQFHRQQFDETTLVKLELFELYTSEWLPVFLCPERVYYPKVHIYDFFAGPGVDSKGRAGSPLRLLSQIEAFLKHPKLQPVEISVHLFDKSSRKIEQLKQNISKLNPDLKHVSLDVQVLPFDKAFPSAQNVLKDPKAAKLLFLDQFGTKHISDEVFASLIHAPHCDFLFFIASATLNRFWNVPAIRQKITRPQDPNQVHRAALTYYRDLIPDGNQYYLAPFSIKKQSGNIYGLIFGSGHPLGIEKFLTSAWLKDRDNGEANFDIYRDGTEGQTSLWPKLKRELFEQDLEEAILSGKLIHEYDITNFCYKHGVLRGHARSVIDRLKKNGALQAAFSSPSEIKYNVTPRPLILLGR